MYRGVRRNGRRPSRTIRTWPRPWNAGRSPSPTPTGSGTNPPRSNAGRWRPSRPATRRPWPGAVKRIKQEEAREHAIAEATNTAAVPNLLTAPVGELEAVVGPGSVDIIATMPPTARGSVEGGVYGDLGRFAAHALRPGGVLLTRAASAHLPRVLQQLAVEGLEYRWIVACYEPDCRTRINARKVTTSWRPWLVYTRSGERPDRNSADYFAAAGAEAAKTATAIEAMIRAWAAPGWTLFDPFCGAGTVLVAGRRAGLHVGGADADTGNVALARQALENETGRDEAADLDELAAGPLPRS